MVRLWVGTEARLPENPWHCDSLHVTMGAHLERGWILGLESPLPVSRWDLVGRGGHCGRGLEGLGSLWLGPSLVCQASSVSLCPGPSTMLCRLGTGSPWTEPSTVLQDKHLLYIVAAGYSVPEAMN